MQNLAMQNNNCCNYTQISNYFYAHPVPVIKEEILQVALKNDNVLEDDSHSTGFIDSKSWSN